jgi:hypothetical protein
MLIFCKHLFNKIARARISNGFDLPGAHAPHQENPEEPLGRLGSYGPLSA